MRLVLILAAALNGLAPNASAQTTSTALEELQSEVRDDIARICLPIQYRDGATAYRSCVTEQISIREEISRADKVMDSFASLSFDDRYAVQQACGSDNTATAKRCISDEIAALLSLPEPTLSDISTDEQYVVQQTCFHAQSNQGASAYRLCQLKEIKSVQNTAIPDYTALNSVERNALQLRCSANQSHLADYRQCLVLGVQDSITNRVSAETAVAAATEIFEPIIDAADNQSAIALVPAVTSVRIQTNTPARLPRVIEPTVESTSEPKLAAATSLQAQPVAEPMSEILPTNQPQAQTQAQIQTTETTPTPEQVETAQSANTANSVEPESTVSKLIVIKDLLLNTFYGLSQQGKLLLGALVVTPLALWALLTGRKRHGYDHNDRGAHPMQDAFDDGYEHQELKDRVRTGNNPALYPATGPTTSDVMDTNDDAFDKPVAFDDDDNISANWAAEVDSLFEDTPSIHAAEDTAKLSPEELPVAELEDMPTRKLSPSQMPITFPATTTEPATQRIPHSAAPSTRANAKVNSRGFATWLHSLPQNEQQSLTIEFLMYWIAFGDERYDPTLKQRIFQTKEPSNQDIVKRWVLKEDVHAFADAIDWLQRNTTSIQKVQIMRFMMAMLVNGQEPTPLQNTLFRFLSDVFYLKDPTLDALFEEDFQAKLPSIPRVDRMAWWDRQSAGTVTSWNSRKLSGGDEITRLAAQLGVDGEARAEHVEAAYEVAAKRCNAERYNQLGESERQLLTSRRQRLKMARDGLLEALA